MSPENTKCLLCKKSDPWIGCKFANQLASIESQSTKAKIPMDLALNVLIRAIQSLPTNPKDDTTIQSERRKEYTAHISLHKKAIRKVNLITNTHLRSINSRCKRAEVQRTKK